MFIYILTILFLLGCGSKNDTPEPDPPVPAPVEDIFGADLSSLPMIEGKGVVYYNSIGEAEDVLTTLKNAGIEIIRIRLWKDPETTHSSFAEVKEFSQRIKAQGLSTWLTVHYSDTWADPGNQKKPEKWNNLEFEDLKDSIYEYTSQVVLELQPDIIQIGNEINSGFLYPEGKLSTNKAQFLELVSEASKAVREVDTNTRIMIHYAGYQGADEFYNNVKSIDYDLIGISYYPSYHGKDMTEMKNSLNSLRSTYGKNIMIAETAYPFTLNWNDWTNNIIGLEEHLILPDYPATSTGQKEFIAKLNSIVSNSNSISGMCYWGGELVAFNGPESKEGSPWENLALYDFNNHALEVMEVIGKQ